MPVSRLHQVQDGWRCVRSLLANFRGLDDDGSGGGKRGTRLGLESEVSRSSRTMGGGDGCYIFVISYGDLSREKKDERVTLPAGPVTGRHDDDDEPSTMR